MKNSKAGIKNVLLLLLGSAILSFGLFNVHSQSAVTEGGILGTTLLLQYWFGISPGISEFVMDMICYLIGFKLLGKQFLINSIIATSGFASFYTLWEFVGPVLPNLTDKPLAAAILGGLFVGIGVGIIVRQGGASGGDDVLALVLNKYLRLNLGKSYFMTDAIVLILSLSYIPFRRIAFSFITVMISSGLIDRMEAYYEKKEAREEEETALPGAEMAEN